MTFFISFVSFALVAGMVVVPFLPGWKSTTFWRGFLLSQLIGAGLLILFAWWSDAQLSLELWWLGLDASQVSLEEQLAGVRTEDLDRARDLIAQGLGVGWPIGVIVGWPVMAAYVCVAVILGWYVRRWLARQFDGDPPGV